MTKRNRKGNIHDEFSVVSGHFQREGMDVSLCCRFWESGTYPVTHESHYEHPSPAFNRLFFFHRGGCRIETPQADFQLKPRRIYLLPIDQSFSVTYHKDSLFDFFHIKVENALGRDVFEGLTGIHTPASSTLGLFNEVINNYRHDTPCRTMRWQTAVFQTVCRFCEDHWTFIKPRMQKAHPLHTVLSHVRENLHPTLSVEDISDHANISRATLNRMFQKHLHMSAKEYVLVMLIQRAKEQLAVSTESVKEIAAMMGYEDPFYFQRLFKQRTGLTPLEFRRQALTRPAP